MADLSKLETILVQGFLPQKELTPWVLADQVFTQEWAALAPGLKDDPLSKSQIGAVENLVFELLALIAKYPSAIPGHGSGHIRRVLGYGLAVALSEERSTLDTARLLLACAGHDLGRLCLAQDSKTLGHGAISALLLGQTTAFTQLPPHLNAPVRRAVQWHTLGSPGEARWFNVLGDVRAADGLDCVGTGAGLLRSIINAGVEKDLSAWLPRTPDEKVWLGSWLTYSLNMNTPTTKSAWNRLERHLRGVEGRNLAARIPQLRGDPAKFASLFKNLVYHAEPDTQAWQLEGMLAQIMALPAEEIERWAGFLVQVNASYLAEARRLDEILQIAVEMHKPLLSSVAQTLRQSKLSDLTGL
jgi:hypothetical protein